jgi:hypothetical protein
MPRMRAPKIRADAIQILVTPEERAKVQEMAAQNSLSMSSYARSRLMRAVRKRDLTTACRPAFGFD